MGLIFYRRKGFLGPDFYRQKGFLGQFFENFLRAFCESGVTLAVRAFWGLFFGF